MASSNTGGWVRRVGSSGPGKTYRQRRPINYYGILVVICVLGFASVALARYDYRHPATAAQTEPPTTSTTWFAALGISTCGNTQPALLPNPSGGLTGFQALANGVIEIAPKHANETGTNATLQKFVEGYPGLTVTKSTLTLPARTSKGKAITFTTGETCPAGTRDAGKVGHVEIAHWKNLIATTATTTTNPSDVRFSSNQLITIGFVPDGVTPPRPPASATHAMLAAPTATTTTTTTLAPSVTTPTSSTSTSTTTTTKP